MILLALLSVTRFNKSSLRMGIVDMDMDVEYVTDNFRAVDRIIKCVPHYYVISTLTNTLKRASE